MTTGPDKRTPHASKAQEPAAASIEPSRPTESHDRGGDGATQALTQEQDALAQMGPSAQLSINEGGRTNDSHSQTNPEGAVHGLPQPALKGTWR